jgi:hypothetical protein
MECGGGLGVWASTLPRRINEEHSAEKEDARNIVEEGRRFRTMVRASDVIIYATTTPVS